MDFLINIFNVALYQPFFNALIWLYEYLPGRDFGVAVIVLTVAIRVLLYPLMLKSIKSQKMLQELQPKLQEIQKKHKGNKELLAKETMELYQREKVNPFGGCLPLLVQLPILIAMYQVFWKGFRPEAMDNLYSFIPNPGTIDPMFLGMINLSESNALLAILAGILQYFQTKMIMPHQKQVTEGDMAKFSGMMQKQMLYFFPIITVVILFNLPAAVGLYWIITAAFSIFQQKLIYSPQKNNQ